MRRTVIMWNGSSFPGVYLTVFKNTPDEREILISVVELEEVLVTEDKTDWLSPETKILDDKITWYVSRDMIHWSEDMLVSEMERLLNGED